MYFLWSQLLAQPSILWTEQRSGVTLSPSSGSLGTTTCRRQSMASRSPAPSGTPTSRFRDSCGWSTRTLAKVGKTNTMEMYLYFLIDKIKKFKKLLRYWFCLCWFILYSWSEHQKLCNNHWAVKFSTLTEDTFLFLINFCQCILSVFFLFCTKPFHLI